MKILHSLYQPAEQTDESKSDASIYDFTVKDTNGENVSLEKFKGNVLIIVNIASKCGLAKSQYANLMELRKEFHDKGETVDKLEANAKKKCKMQNFQFFING